MLANTLLLLSIIANGAVALYISSTKSIDPRSFSRKRYSLIRTYAEIPSTMGSDSLERPDDEDSPEFRIYLKQLLRMQMNRAKTGYAAPSSGSSDAYIAKLNRLKVERNARFRAGLPEVELDTSYKPEDYVNAVLEARDVPVAPAGVKLPPPTPSIMEPTFDSINVNPNARVRGLSDEEFKAAKLADEKVREALAQQQAQGIPAAPATIPNKANQVMKDLPPEEESILDALVTGSAPKINLSEPPVQERKESTIPSTEAPKVDTTYEPVSQPISPTKAAIMAVAPPKVRDEPPTKFKSQGLTRELPEDDIDSLNNALRLLIEHRGGGPFGAGRLKGDQLNELVEALPVALSVMEQDSVLAQKGRAKEEKVAKIDSKPTNKVEKIIKEKVELDQSAIPPSESGKDFTTQPDKVVEPTNEPPMSVVAAPVDQNNFNRQHQQKTIAQGLDDFLANPSQLSIEELDALRDGLIQCLGMVQNRIMDTAIGVIAPSVTPQSQLPSATERIIQKAQQAENNGSSSVSTDVEKDLKITLGLLLKHRGGPGFGHGRLQGKELDLMAGKLRSAANTLLEESGDAE